MTFLKVLIFLIFFSSNIALGERIDTSAGRVDNVLITFFWFDTLTEMRRFLVSEFDMEKDDRLLGYSMIERYDAEQNFCHMDIYAVIPTEVDGVHTLTIGHEIVHCVYGAHYHKRVD